MSGHIYMYRILDHFSPSFLTQKLLVLRNRFKSTRSSRWCESALKIEVFKNVDNKKYSPKMIFFNEFFF
jgi:hypothetical protein